MKTRIPLALACSLVLAGCAKPPEKPPAPAPAAAPAAPKPIDLGTWTRRVTTSSAEAQAAFDRGLVLAYAFNHGAAEEAFREAAQLDPACAMAWWGVALVNGPHINNPAMTDEDVATAWDALGRARALAAGGTPVEQGLIAAIGARYVESAATPRAALDEAYANALRDLAKAHPQDPDLGGLLAEALMDLHPWDLWTQGGDPQPWTPEILSVLEATLSLVPENPLANHLYIHAVEGGPQAAKGVAAADRLMTLVPDAGHLVHMPGHIYVRVGRWAEATQCNVLAIAADARFTAKYPKEPGFYRVYMAHDHQFLAFSEMMRGRSAPALKAARDMVAGIPDEFLAGPGGAFADGTLALPGDVLVRFGRWEEMLTEPEPRGGLPISKVKHRFQRATALTALDRLDEAEAERKAFLDGAKALAPEAFVGNNSAAAIMDVASHVLDGEMAARREKWDDAVASLRKAAALEDALRYDDPPDWIQPVRHSLGAVLLNAGRPAEAEAAYLEDLTRFPENGWSLIGLERALRAQSKAAEADAVAERLRKVWSEADVKPVASCLCQAPKVASN